MAKPAIMKTNRATTLRIAVPYSNHAKYLLGSEKMRSITTRNTVSGLAFGQHADIILYCPHPSTGRASSPDLGSTLGM